jgi:hypothetical protein
MSLLLATLLLIQDPTAENLVEKLGSERIEEREEAAKALKNMGDAARPDLEKATKNNDRETARRAQEILGFLDSQAALETFKKIDKKVEMAKTLRIRFKDTQEGTKSQRGDSGILLLHSGDRASYSQDGSTGSHFWSVSDGVRVQNSRPQMLYDEGITGPVPIEIRPLPKDLGKNLKVLSSRAGFLLPGVAKSAFGALADPGLSKLLQVSRFRQGGADGQSNTLKYRLTVGESDSSFEVTLWYDPKSLQVLKRSMASVRDDGTPLTMIETYDEFTLDADVDDGEFRIPAEK